MKFKVSEKIFEDFPEIVEYIVVGIGLNNEVSSKKINDELDKAALELEGKKDFISEEAYSKWIDVYKKISPKGNYLPSHVALAKRAVDGKRIPHISPIVNFYNSFSLKNGVCVGGEDLDKLYGNMELRYSDGEVDYLGIGGNKVEKVTEGEVVWSDDHSVTCRMWGWRQSERTKITKSTKNYYFIFDTFGEKELEEKIEKFGSDLSEIFGGTVQILRLSKESPELSISHKSGDIKTVDDTIKDLEQLVDTSKSDNKKSKSKLRKRKAKSLNFVDQTHLTKRVSKIVDDHLAEIEISEKSDIDFAKNVKFGDMFSTVALREGKKTSVSPKEIAEKIVGYLSKEKIFTEVSVAPNGFINFRIDENFLLGELKRMVEEDENVSFSDVGDGRTVVVESPSINPNAPAHVGHLRNLLLGRSLSRLFKKINLKVEKDNLINDKDNKVCMAMWGYLKEGADKTPESEGIKKDHFVGRYYVIGRVAYKKDGEERKEIDDMLKKLEDGDEEMTKLWKKLTDWAFEGQLETFERLNEERGFLWFESDLWSGGKEIVESYIGNGIVEKLPDGAVIGRIEDEYGLPDVVLLRSDGTSLYHTQDVNLTIQKIEKYKPWKAIWVVGNEQILHFQRLFAILDRLGIIPIDNLYTYAYGMVLGKDGKKISSRSGGAATADGILDYALEAAKSVLKEKDIEDKDTIAEKVAQGAVRYEFLSKDAFKEITLDIDRAVSFSGKSGSYIMYGYTRANSILDKVKNSDSDIGDTRMSELEKTLLLKLLSYPEVVLSAANNYAPSIIAEYSFEVASLFNNFYENVPVKDSKDGELKFRIMLTQLAANVIKDSLGILGISVIDKM